MMCNSKRNSRKLASLGIGCARRALPRTHAQVGRGDAVDLSPLHVVADPQMHVDYTQFFVPFDKVLAFYTSRGLSSEKQGLLATGSLTLQNIRDMCSKDGVRTYELGGHIETTKQATGWLKELTFHIHSDVIGFDSRPWVMRPFIMHDSVKHGLLWHLHPYDTMPYLDSFNENISNFFSVEDVMMAVTHPRVITAIFNKQPTADCQAHVACIFLFAYIPPPDDAGLQPIDGFPPRLAQWVGGIVDEYKKGKLKIDWKKLQNECIAWGVRFRFFFEYNDEAVSKAIARMLMPNWRDEK